MTHFRMHALGLGAAALLALPVRAQYRAEYHIVGDVFPGEARAVAVNHNPGSGCYGYVYVAGTTPGGTPGVSIRRPVPPLDGSSAVAYEDTGTFIALPDPGSVPSAVVIGPDDTVWILDGGRVLTAPAFQVSGGAIMAVAQMDVAAPATGLRVRGTPSNATVYALETGTEPAVRVYELKGGSPEQAGTAALLRRIPLAGWGGAPPRAAAVDAGGFVFVPRSLGAGGGPAFTILDADGADVTARSAGGFRLPAYAPAVSGGAASFVPDASAHGGGYIQETFSTAAGVFGFRWDRVGNLLDAFGPALAGTGAEYSTVAPPPPAVPDVPDIDESGNLYGLTGADAVTKIARTPRFLTGAGHPSPPAVVNGVLYFGDADGALHAADAATGAPAFRLPVTPGVALLGRPAVQVVNGTTVVLAVSADGRVARVDVTEESPILRWVTPPLVSGATDAATTPAIVDAGNGRIGLFAALGNARDEARVFRLNPETGAVSDRSANLGRDIQSSPSVLEGSLYIGVSGGPNGAYRLSTENLGAPLNSYAAGKSSSAPPFLMAAADGTQRAFLASEDGVLYAVNPSTGNLDADFGGGEVTVTEQARLVGGPFVFEGRVYIGASDNTVYAADALTGAGTDPTGGYVFFNANAGGTEGAVAGGLSATPLPTGGAAIVFGSTNGRVYQVRADDPAVYQVTLTDTSAANAVTTAPTVVPSLSSVFTANANGRVFRIPIYPLPKYDIGQ